MFVYIGHKFTQILTYWALATRPNSLIFPILEQKGDKSCDAAISWTRTYLLYFSLRNITCDEKETNTNMRWNYGCVNFSLCVLANKFKRHMHVNWLLQCLLKAGSN